MTEFQPDSEGRREEILGRCPFLRAFLDETDESGAKPFETILVEYDHYFGEEVFDLMRISLRETIEISDFIDEDFSEKENIIRALLVMGYEIGSRQDTRIFAGQILARLAQMDVLDEDMLYSPESQTSALSFILTGLNTGVAYKNEIIKMKNVAAGADKKRLKPYEDFLKSKGL